MLAQEKRITVTARIEPDICMQADESFFIRLLINLISNSLARTAGRAGHTEVSLYRENDLAVLEVADDGIGISGGGPAPDLGQILPGGCGPAAYGNHAGTWPLHGEVDRERARWDHRRGE